MTHREILVLALEAFSDLGIKDRNRIVADLDNGVQIDLPHDPITAIALNAVTNNAADEDGINSMVNDIDYAIGQLKDVRNALEKLLV